MAVTTPDQAEGLSLRPSDAFLARRRLIDRTMRAVLFLAAALSVFVTVGIVYVLLSESLAFFGEVSIVEFLTSTTWAPTFGGDAAAFGILAPLSGTLLAASIALLVAIPMGTVLAVYLSEYAEPRVREVIKPVLELLEGVPTVIYGYFALLFVTPILRTFLPLSAFNMLSPGLVMGIMILPYVTSVSEDAMRAVPASLREGAYALGFTRLQTGVKVVIPAAFSGITAAYILGMSRAVGETMVVAIAAGQIARFGFDPFQGASTITAEIVRISKGDVGRGGIEYQSIFAAGLALFALTLIFNIVGFYLRRRFREVY